MSEYLAELFIKFNSGKHGEGFTPIYSDFFDSIRFDPITILEIGMGKKANSLMAWHSYFPNADIVMVDNVAKFVAVGTRAALPNCYCYLVDQSKRRDLEKVLVHKGFDIIIDDGSHRAKGQQISLGYLFPFLKSGGLYIIEDLRCDREKKIAKNKRINMSKKQIMRLQICRSRQRMIKLIVFFQKHGVIGPQFKYLLDEEKEFLNDHIKYCELYCSNKLGVFRK